MHNVVADDWRATVTVIGDPDAGVWRHHACFACAPDELDIADES